MHLGLGPNAATSDVTSDASQQIYELLNTVYGFAIHLLLFAKVILDATSKEFCVLENH